MTPGKRLGQLGRHGLLQGLESTSKSLMDSCFLRGETHHVRKRISWSPLSLEHGLGVIGGGLSRQIDNISIDN